MHIVQGPNLLLLSYNSQLTSNPLSLCRGFVFVHLFWSGFLLVLSVFAKPTSLCIVLHLLNNFMSVSCLNSIGLCTFVCTFLHLYLCNCSLRLRHHVYIQLCAHLLSVLVRCTWYAYLVCAFVMRTCWVYLSGALGMPTCYVDLLCKVQGVFFTGTPPKNSKYKKVNLG